MWSGVSGRRFAKALGEDGAGRGEKKKRGKKNKGTTFQERRRNLPEIETSGGEQRVAAVAGCRPFKTSCGPAGRSVLAWPMDGFDGRPRGVSTRFESVGDARVSDPVMYPTAVWG